MHLETIPDDALIRISVLVNKPAKANQQSRHGLLGISRTSLYRLLAAGKFPRPVHPLPGVTAWRAGDIRQWLRSQVQT